MINIISIAIDGFFLYLVIGLLFSIWFVLKGAKMLDDGMLGTPFHLKLILIPGSILLWLPLTIKLLRK